MFALTKAVKITLGRLELQSAEYLEGLDGDITMIYALPQSLIHRLLVVHLTITYSAFLTTETMTATISILHELLGRNELNAIVHHIAPQHFLRVSMIT